MNDSRWHISDIERADIILSADEPINLHHSFIRSHPKDSPPDFRHMHYVLELGIVVNGNYVSSYEDYRTTVSPGQTWLTGIWEPHGYIPTEERSEAAIFVFLPTAFAQDDLQNASGFRWLSPFFASPESRPQARGEVCDQMLQIAAAALQILDQQPDNAKFWYRNFVQEALLWLQKDWDASTVRADASVTSYDRISPAVKFAMESMQLVPTERAAELCKRSLNSFNQLFKSVMGMTFSRFALSYRLGGAAEHLAGTTDPIKAIASRWGFRDVSHLHRNFAGSYGCTPGEYRKRRTGQ